MRSLLLPLCVVTLLLAACGSDDKKGDGYSPVDVPTAPPTFSTGSDDLSGTTLWIASSGTTVLDVVENVSGTTSTRTDTETASTTTIDSVDAIMVDLTSTDPSEDETSYYALADDGWIYSYNGTDWEIFAPETLTAGTKWTISETETSGADTITVTATVRVISIDATAPEGTTGTIHLQSSLSSSGTLFGAPFTANATQDSYYEPGVGMVAEEANSAGSWGGLPLNGTLTRTRTSFAPLLANG